MATATELDRSVELERYLTSKQPEIAHFYSNNLDPEADITVSELKPENLKKSFEETDKASVVDRSETNTQWSAWEKGFIKWVKDKQPQDNAQKIARTGALSAVGINVEEFNSAEVAVFYREYFDGGMTNSEKFAEKLLEAYRDKPAELEQAMGYLDDLFIVFGYKTAEAVRIGVLSKFAQIHPQVIEEIKNKALGPRLKVSDEKARNSLKWVHENKNAGSPEPPVRSSRAQPETELEKKARYETEMGGKVGRFFARWANVTPNIDLPDEFFDQLAQIGEAFDGHLSTSPSIDTALGQMQIAELDRFGADFIYSTSQSERMDHLRQTDAVLRKRRNAPARNRRLSNLISYGDLTILGPANQPLNMEVNNWNINAVILGREYGYPEVAAVLQRRFPNVVIIIPQEIIVANQAGKSLEQLIAEKKDSIISATPPIPSAPPPAPRPGQAEAVQVAAPEQKLQEKIRQILAEIERLRVVEESRQAMKIPGLSSNMITQLSRLAALFPERGLQSVGLYAALSRIDQGILSQYRGFRGTSITDGLTPIANERAALNFLQSIMHGSDKNKKYKGDLAALLSNHDVTDRFYLIAPRGEDSLTGGNASAIFLTDMLDYPEVIALLGQQFPRLVIITPRMLEEELDSPDPFADADEFDQWINILKTPNISPEPPTAPEQEPKGMSINTAKSEIEIPYKQPGHEIMQDVAIARKVSKGKTALIAVMDGISKGGELSTEAAQNVKKAINAELSQFAKGAEAKTPTLEEARDIILNALVKAAGKNEQLAAGNENIGTTAAIGMVCELNGKQVLLTVNLGDSRISKYNPKTGQITQLTTDHSLIQSYLRGGGDPAMFNRDRLSIIYKDVSNEKVQEAVYYAQNNDITQPNDYFSVTEIEDGDVFIAYSDGLDYGKRYDADLQQDPEWNRLVDEKYKQIAQSANEQERLLRFAKVLAEEARNSMSPAGADDISVAVMQISLAA